MVLTMDLFRRPVFPMLAFAQRQFSVSSFLLGEKIPIKKIKKKDVVVPSAAAVAAAALAASPTATPVHPGHNPRGTNPKKHPARIHSHVPAPPRTWHANIDWNMDRNSVLSYRPHAGHHWQDWKMLRDVRRRAYVERDGTVRKRLLMIYRSSGILPKELGEEAHNDVNKLVRDTKYTRIVDRCVFTSRPRGVVKRWRLSRIVWRDIADHNQMSGVMRADWMYRNDKTHFHNQAPDLHDTLSAIDPLQGGRGTYYTELENKWYWSGYNFRPVYYNQSIFKKPFTYPPPLPEDAPRIRNNRRNKASHLFLQPWQPNPYKQIPEPNRMYYGLALYGRPDYNDKGRDGENYTYRNWGVPSGPVKASDVPVEEEEVD